MGKDELVPTKCVDWTLNIDADTKKEFWWNSPHSISIWQTNVNVPDVSSATDDLVWKHFLRYQEIAVYKLCVVCDGPEQNDDMVICYQCGGTAHTECAERASSEKLTKISYVDPSVVPKMCCCRKCAKLPLDSTRKIAESPANARRATIRSLTATEEYEAFLTTGLRDLLKKCNPKLSPSEDAELMRQCQTLVARHFQPNNSASLVRKERIVSKAGGIGVVAATRIPSLTVIGVYPGYEDPLSGEQAKCGRPGPKYSLVDLNCADYFNNVFEEFGMTITPFINEPNTNEFSNTAWIQEPHRPEGRLSVMTVRDIEPGEEVLIGYGPLYPRTYPHNYDAYAFHKVDGYDDPPCFALWHWKTLEEKDADFVLYCGYDAKTDSYSYWETEDEAKDKK